MSNNSGLVDTSKMIRIELLKTSKIEYSEELVLLSQEAIAFIEAKSWCKKILNGWLARGWGYIIGVFYFHFIPSQPDIPEYIWVIVGDLPPAYLDVEYCPSVMDAIEGYVCEFQEWVDRVLNDRPIDESVIPVNVPPDKEWARLLQNRLNIIREDILDISKR